MAAMDGRRLIEAGKAGDLLTARELIMKGADVNYRDKKDGSTAVYWSACNGHAYLCQYLIQCGADIHIPVEWGSLPLHAAADRGHHDCMFLLLKSGSDPNTRNSSNEDTALHLAAHRGHLLSCQTLLEFGANPGEKNDKDRTAVEEAELAQHPDLALLLRKHILDPHHVRRNERRDIDVHSTQPLTTCIEGSWNQKSVHPDRLSHVSGTSHKNGHLLRNQSAPVPAHRSVICDDLVDIYSADVKVGRLVDVDDVKGQTLGRFASHYQHDEDVVVDGPECQSVTGIYGIYESDLLSSSVENNYEIYSLRKQIDTLLRENKVLRDENTTLKSNSISRENKEKRIKEKWYFVTENLEARTKEVDELNDRVSKLNNVIGEQNRQTGILQHQLFERQKYTDRLVTKLREAYQVTYSHPDHLTMADMLSDDGDLVSSVHTRRRRHSSERRSELVSRCADQNDQASLCKVDSKSDSELFSSSPEKNGNCEFECHKRSTVEGFISASKADKCNVVPVQKPLVNLDTPGKVWRLDVDFLVNDSSSLGTESEEMHTCHSLRIYHKNEYYRMKVISGTTDQKCCRSHDGVLVGLPPHPNITPLLHHYQTDAGQLGVLSASISPSTHVQVFIYPDYILTLDDMLNDTRKYLGDVCVTTLYTLLVQLLYQVCGALGHLAHHGVHHGDIAPTNVFLDHSLRPLLGNFHPGHICAERDFIEDWESFVKLVDKCRDVLAGRASHLKDKSDLATFKMLTKKWIDENSLSNKKAQLCFGVLLFIKKDDNLNTIQAARHWMETNISTFEDATCRTCRSDDESMSSIRGLVEMNQETLKQYFISSITPTVLLELFSKVYHCDEKA